MVLPNQAEGNPFFTMIDELQGESNSDGVIRMKLDKVRLLDAESTLHSLLIHLVKLSSRSDQRSLNANELLKLT